MMKHRKAAPRAAGNRKFGYATKAEDGLMAVACTLFIAPPLNLPDESGLTVYT